MLETAISPLTRNNRVTLWSDKQIRHGLPWQEQIEKALMSARCAILLVSQYFMASDFIADNELPRLLERARNERIRMCWVAVSAALVSSDIRRYQALNDPSKPLDSLRRSVLNSEMVSIATKIEAALRLDSSTVDLPRLT